MADTGAGTRGVYQANTRTRRSMLSTQLDQQSTYCDPPFVSWRTDPESSALLLSSAPSTAPSQCPLAPCRPATPDNCRRFWARRCTCSWTTSTSSLHVLLCEMPPVLDSFLFQLLLSFVLSALQTCLMTR